MLQVRELSKGFDGKQLWLDIKFDVKRGEADIGIIGPNGSGKTTLLKVLLGEEDANSGAVKWGANLNIGYYDQRLGTDEFDPDNTVMDEVLGGRNVTGQQLRDALGTMLFRGDDVYKPIRLLSGGERAGSGWPSCCSISPTSSFSTSRPTTWTSPPARDWKPLWARLRGRSSASATTAISWTA